MTVGVPQIGHSFGGFGLAQALALAALDHGRDDARDHVAGAGDDHLVALAHVLARQVLLVVQGRGRDGDAADVHGLEHRERHQVPGPAHVPDDLVELRRHRRRRELPGDRPARLAARDAELPPQAPLVDLDDDAVDLEVELVAALLPPLAARHELVAVLMAGDVAVDAEATLAEPLELVAVRGVLDAVAEADPVGPHLQRPRGGQLRIQLAQGAGGGVAGVGEGRLARLGPLLVEAVEARAREVDLAADLDLARRVRNPQRDRADRLQVRGHVLADRPVAARQPAHEDAVLVGERDREPVDLRLGHVGDLLRGDVEALEQVADPLLPGRQLLRVARVGQRQHRLGVLVLLELVERLAADALRRRVRARAAPGARPRGRGAR